MLSFHINTFFIVNEMCLPISVQDSFVIPDKKIKKFPSFPLLVHNLFISLRCKMRAHVRTMHDETTIYKICQ